MRSSVRYLYIGGMFEEGVRGKEMNNTKQSIYVHTIIHVALNYMSNVVWGTLSSNSHKQLLQLYVAMNNDYKRLIYTFSTCTMC